MAEISKITLPSGNTYDIKDAYARELIAGGITFIVSWDGSGAPDITKIPAGVTVTYNGTSYTGTLTTAAAQAGAFYLVKSSTQTEVLDIYDEYTIVGPEGARIWEKLGDTKINLDDLGALAYKDNVTLNKGTGDNVLGEATTFTNASSAVSFSGGATDKVLGSDATFTTTVTPTTTNIKATASGGGAAWNSKDQKTVLTGVKVTAQPIIQMLESNTIPDEEYNPYITLLKGGSVSRSTNAAVGASGTDTFVKSYPGATSKLATTTVPNVTGNDSVSIPNVTSVGAASTWNFAMGSGNDAETLIISGTNSTTPTLGTALSASKVTLGTAKTVATGSLSASGSGGTVMTGLGTATTASAVTGVEVTTQPSFSFNGTDTYVFANASGTAVGANGTASVIGASSTFTNTQPTVALATGATAGTGVISVATGITSASTTTNNKDEVTAVTNIGTGTAAAQTITVGTNDKVKVAKYDDLSVTVS